MLLQAEDRRLAALSAELEATSKELNAGRKRLKADLDVALETSKANDATRSELAARERDVDLHEARLKEWRESTKADVAKQVSDQERKLQVRCNELQFSRSCMHFDLPCSLGHKACAILGERFGNTVCLLYRSGKPSCRPATMLAWSESARLSWTLRRQQPAVTLSSARRRPTRKPPHPAVQRWTAKKPTSRPWTRPCWSVRWI